MVDEPKKPEIKETGQIESSVSKTMLFGFGGQGVARTSSSGQLRITSRQLFQLRKRHSYIAAVHNAIIKQVKKVELMVTRIDPKLPFNEETKKRMEAFIRTGFGELGEKEFRGRMIDTKKWNGDAFAEIVFDAAGMNEPVMVQYVMAETMRILPNIHGQIVGYPQVVDGALIATFSPENIMHLKEHHDEYSFFGYPDLESLLSALLLDTLAEEHSTAKLENDATANGILSFENAAEDDLARLRVLFIKELRQNPGKPVFLNATPQWLPMDAGALKDIDFQELHRMVKERVMMVYSVLPMQVAVVETGKLANPEQQLEIGEEYIRQELEQQQNMYNLKLTPKFQNSENLMYKFAELDPKLDASKKEADIAFVKVQTAEKMASMPGIYTINEVRNATGHEEVEDGDLRSRPIAAPNLFAPPIPPTENATKSVETKPFAGYANFEDCVAQNSDKENPQAYCAAIMQAVEGSPAEQEKKSLTICKISRVKIERAFSEDLTRIQGRFTKEAVKLAKQHYPKEDLTKKVIDSILNPIIGQQNKKETAEKSASGFELALAPIVAKLKQEIEDSTKKHALAAFKVSKESLGFAMNQQDEKAVLASLMSRGTIDAIKDFSAAQKAGFREVVQNAISEGLDLNKMVKDMRNFSETETYKLERIARTESNRLVNEGRFSGYEELEERRGEEYEYDWIGPDDDRTTEICTDIKANNPYSLEEIERATDGGEPHINCRHNAVRRV